MIALPFLIPCVREYRFGAPITFGLPAGVDLLHILDYVAAYRSGRDEAEKDLRSGRLAVEQYGLPLPPEYREILQQRYQIDLRLTAGDTDVTDTIIGHARGYNDISKLEIKRRFGDGVLEAAADEALKHWNEKPAK